MRHFKVTPPAKDYLKKLRYSIDYGLAIKLLSKENNSGKFSTQISTLTEKLSQQEALMKEQEPNYSEVPTTEEAAGSKEWEQFSQPDDDWKKKTIYD